MKITFIYPGVFSSSKAKDAMQPLAVAALAAHTPRDWDITFFDDRIEEVDMDHDTDLVAMPVLTYSAKRAYKLSGLFRQRGIPVILGGFHPTLLPEEALEHCDTVVCGDAENVWPQVLNDFKNGRLQPRYDSGVCSSPELIQYDRSVFNGKKYTPMIPVQLTRGCRFTCDFCSIHAFYGRSLLTRPLDHIIDEVRNIPNRFLFLVDDNLLSHEAHLLPFLRQMRDLKKHWSCQISVDAAFNPELLKLLREAGCTVVFVGFESMELDNLKSMGKGENLKHKNYHEVISRFRDAGLMVCGSFVFGYDHDREETIWKALEFGIREQLTLCHFNPLYPYPKTRVYEKLQAEGRLIYNKWWLDDDFRYGEPMFRPKNIEPRRLTEACYEARLEFNKMSCIFKRSFNSKNNSRTPFQWGTFMISNLISRKEIRNKQGEALG